MFSDDKPSDTKFFNLDKIPQVGQELLVQESLEYQKQQRYISQKNAEQGIPENTSFLEKPKIQPFEQYRVYKRTNAE